MGLHCFLRQQQSILWQSFTVALLTVFLCSTRSLGDLNDDTEGLKAFYNAFNASNLSQWNNASASVCEWEGVACKNTAGGETRVFFLRLPKANLNGAIPPTSLSRLAQLRVISLHSNQISGPIPQDLSNCSFLRSIYLQKNRLVGPLPSNFSQWPNLVHLDLSYNAINGSIPSSIANLTQLKSLYLQNNSLSGPIPPIDIGTLTNFSVAYNNLSGPVPNTSTFNRFLATGAFLGNGYLCGGPPLASCPLPPPPLQSPSPSPSPTPPSSSSPSSQEEGRKKLRDGEVAGIVIGSLALLLILATLVFLACRRKDRDEENIQGKAKVESRGVYAVEPPPGYASSSSAAAAAAAAAAGGGGGGAAGARGVVEVEGGEKKDLVFFDGTRHLEFSMEELLRASAEVLGKGSVGTAYKAVLESGLVVAVKRLKDVTLDRAAFQSQLHSVGNLSHPNLVPILAYYYASEEKLLVTEYMPNGSLSALLHGNKGANRTPLDWDTRMKIAAGAAEGLDYLHNEGIVHGNIKSSNILLTKNYTACVSDYGVTQLVSATPAVNRILGYRAPEVTDIRRTGPKADVYSFGVLLIELLTGKAPVHASASDDNGIDLPRWVQSVAQEEWSTQVFDKELMKYQGNIEEEMVGMLHIAQQCVAPSPDQRTPFKQVVEMIKNLRKNNAEIIT